MKVIFMGTPYFAVPTLQKLIDDPEIKIVAVYTKEPQIAGRGHKLQKSEIHQTAEANNLKVLTSKSLKTPEAKQEFIKFNADIAVVVAYGLMLPQQILDAPKLGCVNIHPSLLPKWRGAAPLQRSIMNGDNETGVSIVQMTLGLDSGNIIAQKKFPLDSKVTYKDLAEKTSKMGAEILLETIKNMHKGDFSLIKQDDAKSTYANKIDKEECLLDFNRSATEIDQIVRGLNGFLGAYFIYKEEKIKIFQVEIIDLQEELNKERIGQVLDIQFTIQCKFGKIRPVILQRPGKKAMTLSEFLRGL